MRQIFLPVLTGFLVLLNILPVRAQDKAPLPWRACWQVPTVELADFAIASDNAGNILLPLLNGTVQSLDKTTGQALWTTRLGGELASDMLVANNRIFIATKENEGGAGKRKTVKITALSVKTGLALWQAGALPAGAKTETAEEAEKAEKVFLLTAGNNLFVLSDSGYLRVLEIGNGSEVAATQLAATTRLQPTNPTGFFLLSAEKKILLYQTDRRQIAKTIITSGAPTALLPLPKNRILIGDQPGRVLLLDLDGEKILWSARTGAAVRDIAEGAGGYLVVSDDNFVYLLSRKSGGRIWKRRFQGRIKAAFDSGRASGGVFAVLSDQSAFLLEEKTGKIIDRFEFPENFFFIGKPLLRDNRLIIPTTEAVIGFKAGGCKTSE